MITFRSIDDLKHILRLWPVDLQSLTRQEISTARFVIGNELNANSQTRTQKYLEWYATVYVAAAKQMSGNPRTTTISFGEAYYGNGSTLMAALDEIQAASGGHLSSLVSRLCFRFMMIYQRSPNDLDLCKVAREYSLDPEQLHLMELSKSEKQQLTIQSMITNKLLFAI